MTPSSNVGSLINGGKSPHISSMSVTATLYQRKSGSSTVNVHVILYVRNKTPIKKQKMATYCPVPIQEPVDIIVIVIFPKRVD